MVLLVLWCLAAAACTGDAVDADLVAQAQERLGTVTDPDAGRVGVGDVVDVDHCPLWKDSSGNMSVGDQSLMCLLVYESQERSPSALFVSMGADGDSDLETFLLQLMRDGSWESEPVEPEDDDSQLASVCHTLDRSSVPTGPGSDGPKLVCVAEFRRDGLAITYVIVNPHRSNVAEERLSRELTPVLERLIDLDPSI